MIRWTENNRNIQGQFLPAAYTDILRPQTIGQWPRVVIVAMVTYVRKVQLQVKSNYPDLHLEQNRL